MVSDCLLTESLNADRLTRRLLLQRSYTYRPDVHLIGAYYFLWFISVILLNEQEFRDSYGLQETYVDIRTAFVVFTVDKFVQKRTFLLV